MELEGIKCDYLWLSGFNGCYKCSDWGNCDIDPNYCCLDCEENELYNTEESN